MCDSERKTDNGTDHSDKTDRQFTVSYVRLGGESTPGVDVRLRYRLLRSGIA
jgi:hypothetical protein